MIKMARPKEDPAMLAKEGLWMDFLSKNRAGSAEPGNRFRIPVLVHFAHGFVFRLKHLPRPVDVIKFKDQTGSDFQNRFQ